VRTLDREALLVVLIRVLSTAPAGAVRGTFPDYRLTCLEDRQDPTEGKTLTQAVQEFCESAKRGDYYQELWLGARHSSMKSSKTEEFGALLTLLFDGCVAEAESGDSAEVCKAYELLFDLLRDIDRCETDIVFWADEPGTWQLGVDWTRVLSPYFRCLRSIVTLQEFGERANAVIGEFAPGKVRAPC
jgi:hypothetical protein